MSDLEPLELTDEERDEFLGTGGTGVISVATPEDTPPHSIPVSYGYDATDVAFYFRLAVSPEGSKPELPDRAVTFVVADTQNDVWHSVVAKGHLEETTDEDIATETLQGLERVEIPIVDIFGAPLQDVSFEFYRLLPASITGRKEQRRE